MNTLKHLMTSLLLSVTVSAIADDVTVDNITAIPGENADVVINFTTTSTNITGYQMSLYLPEGVTLQKDEDDDYVYNLSSRHNKSHAFSVNKQADGGLMLVCYSLTKKTITAGSGELLRLPIGVDANAAGILPVGIKSIKMSDTSSNVTQLDDVTFNIICTAATPEKTEQSLSLNTLPNMTVGETAYTLPATTAEGLALTWTSSNSTVATISNGELDAVGAGTAVITATQAGNDSYSPFERMFTLTVEAAAPEPEPQPTVNVTDITTLDNLIYIEPTEVQSGTQVNISFKMKNSSAIRGFQFDLYLPEGVTAVKNAKGRILGSLSSGRLPTDDEHTLTISKQSDGAIRFLCGSQYDETFTGSEGEIATLTVEVADDMEEGDYPIVVKDMRLSETDISKYYDTELIQSRLTVTTVTPGDINRDGVVNVSDYIGIANHIMGNTPTGFVEKAADVNGDSQVNVSDYIGVANIILTGNPYGTSDSVKRALPTRVRQAPATDISALDNVIYIEQQTLEAGKQTSLSFKMKNTAAIRGFQFDLYLPEGITAATNASGRIRGSLSAARLSTDDEHTLTLAVQSDGAIRFLCGSQYDETFTGADGEIATLIVEVADDMVAGDYPIVMKTMRLSETDISNFYDTELIETMVSIVEATDGRVVLDENSMAVIASSNGVVDVRVVRSIKANEWSTICLPFDMTEAQVTAAFGDDVQLAEFISYDVNDDATELTVTFEDADMAEGLYANYPYIIRTSRDITEFTADGVTIAPDEENAVVEYAEGRGKNRHVYGTFIGTFHAQTTVPANCLFLSGSNFWYSTGLTQMKAFRAYFDLEDVLAGVDAAGVKMYVSIDGVATDISEMENVECKMEGSVYDLSGHRMAKPRGKGVYVVGGRKVAVR